MARNFMTIPRLPLAVTLTVGVVAIGLGVLSIFAAAPRFDSFARGLLLGGGCTLLVVAGMALAPLVWSTLTPSQDTPDWRPSGTTP